MKSVGLGRPGFAKAFPFRRVWGCGWVGGWLEKGAGGLNEPLPQAGRPPVSKS